MEKASVLGETATLEESPANRCVVCNHRNWTHFQEARDFRRPNEGRKFKLDRCLSCGHVMQNPLPSAEELSRAYAVDYAPYRPAWNETGWPIWRIFRELTTFRRIRRLKRYAQGSKLLEVGSGAGDFLYAASRAGWKVAAVEYNKALADLLRSELRFDVRSGELTRGVWEKESFDTLVLWSVLEHVPDPIETLNTVSYYLKPGGTVFFQLPTIYGLSFGRRFGKHWHILDLPRHLHFFGKESLSSLCGKAGMNLTVFKTPLLDTGWCYLASCSNYANESGGWGQRLLKLALLAPVIVLTLPYMAVQAWRGHGAEAFAVAVKG